MDEAWKFYSAVSLAILGSVVGSDKLKAAPLHTAIILGGFFFFALANAVVIYNTQEVAYALANLVEIHARKENIPMGVLPRASRGWQVASFHMICDIALGLAVYVISKRSWTSESKRE